MVLHFYLYYSTNNDKNTLFHLKSTCIKIQVLGFIYQKRFFTIEDAIGGYELEAGRINRKDGEGEGSS